MPAKDLGVKHLCWKCATKFYDLRKADAVCPKCGSDPRAAPKVKAPTAAERRRKEPVEETAEPLEEADLDEELDDEADDKDEKDDKDDT